MTDMHVMKTRPCIMSESETTSEIETYKGRKAMGAGLSRQCESTH